MVSENMVVLNLISFLSALIIIISFCLYIRYIDSNVMIIWNAEIRYQRDMVESNHKKNVFIITNSHAKK